MLVALYSLARQDTMPSKPTFRPPAVPIASVVPGVECPLFAPPWSEDRLECVAATGATQETPERPHNALVGCVGRPGEREQG